MKFVAILLCAALLLSFAGCTVHESKDPSTGSSASSSSSSSSSSASSSSSSSSTSSVFVPPVIHPDTVGIYIPAADGTAARQRVRQFVSKWTAKQDIDCFEILAAEEDYIAGTSFRGIWSDAWNAQDPSPTAKIGFSIILIFKDGSAITKQLLKPGDSTEFFEYLEIYMYDDIHQTPGVWYTHLEDKDMKEDTIISSIKLTAGSRIGEIADIALTAFIYDGADCFDDSGKYIGDVWDAIMISQP